jgi:hypothetical protein
MPFGSPHQTRLPEGGELVQHLVQQQKMGGILPAKTAGGELQGGKVCQHIVGLIVGLLGLI